tara:strand:+ start:1048 stop:1254 length:207 start_codon:yes stop_codon:yes gene_type:complete
MNINMNMNTDTANAEEKWRDAYFKEALAAADLRWDICWAIGLLNPENPALAQRLDSNLKKHEQRRVKP